MEFNELLTAISTVGFPIVAYGALFYKSYKVDAKQTEAINKNTEAVTTMAESIKILCSSLVNKEV